MFDTLIHATYQKNKGSKIMSLSLNAVTVVVRVVAYGSVERRVQRKHFMRQNYCSEIVTHKHDLENL